MEIVRRLADYVAVARDQSPSEKLRDAACRAVFDLLIAAAAGIGAPGPRAVRRAARETMAGGALPVWFTGHRTGLPGAVWCNSSAAAALDLDDGHRIARGHPGAAIIPFALAAGAMCGASTDRLLQAIVIGYEVGVAVGAARRFYANTGMWSGYGVVAALGALRGTLPDTLAHAFSIAGASAPNQLHAGAGPHFRAQEGSDIKEGIPWSGVTALNAVLLAEHGHSGPLGLLDDEAHFRLHELTEGLGSQDYITRNYIKFHACCRHVHAPVEALLGLIANHRLDPRRIERIDVATYSGALRLANRPCPLGFTDIQFSIPYCLGLVALDGADALLPLAPEAFGREDVVAFAQKIHLSLDPEIEARFPAETLARLTVRAEGQDHVSPLTAPRGEASDPADWDALESKLHRACCLTMTPAQRESLIRATERLRDGDHSEILQCLGGITLLSD